MAVTAKMVKELREITGAGMLDCKKALVETDGKIQEAIDYLRKKGITKAAKKSGRIAAEGLVVSKLSADNKKGIILEFNSETDFAAKNENVIGFANKLAGLALTNNVSSVEELEAIILDGKSVKVLLTELIAKVGENMSIRRFIINESNDGFVCTYTHLGGKIGVILPIIGELNAETEGIAKDICMHIAAMDPKFLTQDEVTTEVLDKEKEIAKVQLEKEGKPAQIIEKILIGKMRKFYEENCLLNQKFVKDDKQTVEQYIKDLKIISFDRYKLGEGIEKAEDNFADEVARTIAGN